jgi:hypothetical protein
MKTIFGLYLIWLNMCLTWMQYPVDMDEVRALRNCRNIDHNEIENVKRRLSALGV